jgi:N4-gp56 family major capsid protein
MNTVAVSVSEYGHAAPWSQLSQLSMNCSVEEIARTLLARDCALALDKAAYTAFKAANLQYVGTATNGGDFTTDASATATNTSALNLYHVAAIKDYFVQTAKIPPFDASGAYAAILSPKAHRNLADDTTILSYREYGDPGSLLKGEVGMVEGFRLVISVENLDNAIGAGTLSGEAVFFGDSPLYEAQLVAEHVRVDDDDFGRTKALAWYYVGGFGALLNYMVFWNSKA